MEGKKFKCLLIPASDTRINYETYKGILETELQKMVLKNRQGKMVGNFETEEDFRMQHFEVKT